MTSFKNTASKLVNNFLVKAVNYVK